MSSFIKVIQDWEKIRASIISPYRTGYCKNKEVSEFLSTNDSDDQFSKLLTIQRTSIVCLPHIHYKRSPE
jgi:hypothetical protein